MKVQNVLVFPAGTEIGLEIHNALQYSKFVKLFGATSLECHADFVFENYIEELAPYVDDPAFVPYMNRIIDQYEIDWIYPAHDSALLTLAEHREELHCPIVAAPTKTVQICRDKNKTYQFFDGSWYITNYYHSVDEVKNYPVFIKPAVGQGATDARRIDDREHLVEALSNGVEYAICEYLPGDEYTIDCFTDKNGILRFANQRIRDRIVSGIAVHSHVLPVDDEIMRIAEDINSKLVFTGAWFFQLKKNSQGEYRLLEIAPRIAGTMAVTRNLGVNMEMLTLYTMWGYDVDLLINEQELHLDRAFNRCFKSDLEYDRIYIDFTDTLVINGKVNPQMIQLLYQAKNQGKKLYLFKPKKADLEEYHLVPAMFESIYSDDIETKVNTISSKAILIDDDFICRQAVKEKAGIPVYDVDMIESLLVWKM